MNPAVSVIVPVYKVEEYIEKCARSLFEQTLKEVEYIFVNDRTPDGSMDVLRRVLEDYPQRAAAVKIVDKPQNQGLPAARKSGLALATGRYISHCDSDDWMEPNMLERMYLEADAYDADAVVCAWFSGPNPQPTKYTMAGENCRDYIFSDMIAVGEMQSVWRYMVKREIYSKGVEFPLHNQGEDHTLLVQLAYHCKSIYCVRMPLYHWRYNADSITHAPSDQAVTTRFRGACANARQVDAFLKSHGAGRRYAPEIVAMKVYAMFYFRPVLRKGQGLAEWRKAFPETKGKVLFNKHIKFAHKIEYMLNIYFPPAIIRLVYKWRKRCRS